MEDFYYAGGLRGVLDRLRDLLHTGCLTVTGRTLGEELEGALVCNDEVIAPREAPIGPEGASPSCAATWRPTAPSSSTPRRSAGCSSTRAPRSCSGTTTISPRGSTIRRCR